MAVQQQDQVAEVADVINRYLISRPNATETVEGVAKWWLVRQRYQDSMDLVQRALELLVEYGDVEKVSVAGGKVMYRKARLARSKRHPRLHVSD
jgi:Fe2+ or Zn2+ uptake regulation protein